MDGQKKLTRTQSSLLRSSPTVRSSIQSLSSITEIPSFNDGDHHHHHHNDNKHNKRRPGLSPSPNLNPNPIVAVAAISVTLLTAFIYLKTEESGTSENLLLALMFIAVGLFYLGKNRELLNRSKSVLKQLYNESTKPRSKSVEWYIGNNSNNDNKKEPDRVQTGFGERVEIYSNGDYYEGEFNKGKCNGSGVYKYYVKGRYEGEWVDGKYEGYGIESWARGSKYRGQYRGGLRNGYGVYRFYTGDSYAGQWFNGHYNGLGLQNCFDGSCYFGEFKCGIKHGLGSYHFRNGDRYAGEYFGDKIHGYGVYHFANGHCYEGSWHEGRKQGYGMYTFRSGETNCGEWDCGSLKTPSPPLTDSVLRAVQAAQKAAENAIHLPLVDDQVNKAVMAANRAATSARVAAVKAVQNRFDGSFHDTDV